jgi:hypothetical protein
VCAIPVAIFAYPENGTLERTACLHQIFCFKLGENAIEIFRMLKSMFWRADSGENMSI